MLLKRIFAYPPVKEAVVLVSLLDFNFDNMTQVCLQSSLFSRISVHFRTARPVVYNDQPVSTYNCAADAELPLQFTLKRLLTKVRHIQVARTEILFTERKICTTETLIKIKSWLYWKLVNFVFYADAAGRYYECYQLWNLFNMFSLTHMNYSIR